jgi:hypothetical protein
MARPTGSLAEFHKVRRDYRFGQETMQQIADGMAVFGGSLKETTFVERAIGHYAEFLAGDPEALAPLTQELEWLQEHVRQLRHDQQTSQGVAQYAAEKATDQAQEIAQLQAQVSEFEHMLDAAKAQAANQEQEKQRLQAQVQRLENELLTTKTALRTTQTALQVSEEKLASGLAPGKPTRRKPSQEPRITIDDLTPSGFMGGFWLRWEQDGLLAVVSLDSVDEYSSARGYRLQSFCSSVAHPDQPLTERQQEKAETLTKLARTRMVEELLKAGWKPGDPANPEASWTIWKYQPQAGEKA